MTAYYNENDPFAAAWLRNLITLNLISQGEVDERSIVDVQPSDLKGFTQCHFFAGIGIWSHALRQAGWPDDRPVWTGSCPCQSFSAAGARKGFDDKRHLWPEFFRLISQCRPDTILGEQVASKDALAWLDLVSTDLEGENYAVGAVDTCAAGFGAPHIRQRLWWVADSAESRRPEARQHGSGPSLLAARSAEYGGTIGMADSGSQRRQQICGSTSGYEAAHGREGWNGSESHGDYVAAGNSKAGDMEHSPQQQVGLSRRAWESRSSNESGLELPSRVSREDGQTTREGLGRPASSSYWSDCDWLPCIDGKARPVEPGTFPLAHGYPNRVGTLRGYGNALVAPQAQAFIEAYMDCC